MRGRLLLFSLLLSAAACGTSSRLIEDRLSTPAVITAVELGNVRFDYARWANRDEADHATAKRHEAEWAKALGDAFLARATQRGLASGGERTPVDITIVDLDPGRHTHRSDFGIDDGPGIVTAVVEPRGHGSFRMNAKITVGAWGGDFQYVLEKLGKDAADHLLKRARG